MITRSGAPRIYLYRARRRILHVGSLLLERKYRAVPLGGVASIRRREKWVRLCISWNDKKFTIYSFPIRKESRDYLIE